MTRVDPSPRWRLALPRGRFLDLSDRPKVMGIVNVTPDSFSDGGRFLGAQAAVEHGLRLLDEGADLLDVGAESTRPGGGVYGDGAAHVPADEEMRRLLPVLQGLREATEAPISVDTRKGEVARAVLEAGADLINDIAMLSDDTLIDAVAAAGCPVIVMHSRGAIATMQREIAFDDVVADVAADLAAAAHRAGARGVADDQLVFDPGIGFGKTAEQNVALLARQGPLARLGRPILIGASRKSFIANVAAIAPPAPPDRRLGGSLAAVAAAARRGVALVRVHDVAETVQFLRLEEAIDLADSAIH